MRVHHFYLDIDMKRYMLSILSIVILQSAKIKVTTAVKNS